MTKKDYIQFAEMIRELKQTAIRNVDFDKLLSEHQLNVLREVQRRMCRIFAADNDRFDQDRFNAACEP